jgi:hypothetical protein
VGVVIVIGPDAAPGGTVATIRVPVAEIIVAGILLNVTVFSLSTLLNPAPYIVSEVPTGALFGVNSMMVTTEERCRLIERRFPTASYV